MIPASQVKGELISRLHQETGCNLQEAKRALMAADNDYTVAYKMAIYRTIPTFADMRIYELEQRVKALEGRLDKLVD